ncbi:hypothetical protein C463_17598 [Halorubrum californiense DSM 19288]|uniref:Uncharacterized protein n=1 Tax=Halorubrum californiense DSM 19288 TaxID=1227465 RepID=M0DWQ9_9EURY|nr:MULTISPECIES: hypothetical protein [Halorubrum]ELZ39152.1 hypothetical protein C463_17598 [Halorubrum californiense DSM 19288]TKX71993.1 hypothetical protein EXE40_05795 [Halorubrum sp. GN11GM_10-3_MGM]
MSSVERRIDVDLDADDNAAQAIVEERRELKISELFNNNGELRLWQDSAGCSGYKRDEIDGETAYFSVNTRFDEDEWISKIRCGERAVHDAIRNHIEERHAGGVGNFVKRCSPP